MPKIVKNGKEYSGVPIECVTAWQPTGDPVQVAEPLMGNTDISEIGDGTITGAISELKNDLTELLPTQGKYITVGSQGSSFTAPHTGFYVLAVFASSSSSYMTLMLHDSTRGIRVGSVFSTSGVNSAATVFLVAGHSIQVLTRTNVSEAYLYY